MAIDTSKIYHYHFEARGNELDSYQHVNNAVYLNYMEQARWRLIHEAGLLNQLQSSGMKVVIVEIHIRYKKEIRLFDEMLVETKVKKELPYIVFDHRIVKASDRTLHARAKVKSLLLDAEYSPTDIPKEIFVNEEVL
ncbi:MAG: acyl-CoA thioesterase [Bacteroidales bacterium]